MIVFGVAATRNQLCPSRSSGSHRRPGSRPRLQGACNPRSWPRAAPSQPSRTSPQTGPSEPDCDRSRRPGPPLRPPRPAARKDRWTLLRHWHGIAPGTVRRSLPHLVRSAERACARSETPISGAISLNQLTCHARLQAYPGAGDRCGAAWLPVVLSGLGGGVHRCSSRGLRARPCACELRPGGSRVSADRPLRPQARAYGAMVGIRRSR